MNMKKLLTSASAVAMLTGCATTFQAPHVSQAAVNTAAANQQAQGSQQLLRYNRTPEQNAAMVQQVFNRIKTSAGPVCSYARASCDQYQVEYVNDPIVNAFAYNGNRVRVTSGLMQYVNETQLATVLSHETGHLIAKHNQKMQQTAGITGLVTGILGAVVAGKMGADPNLGAQMGQAAGAVGVLMPFSRDAEREADYLGGYLLNSAGYDLNEGGKVWNILAALRGGKGEPPALLSTHPHTAERAAAWEVTKQEVQQNRSGLPRLNR